jgi:predicted CxxxxCH...CXXCH cytochrome family protein
VRLVLVLLAAAACSDERPRLVGEAEGVHGADFVAAHGADLAMRGWDFALCQTCHGEDLAGGKSGVSCVSCHPQGPTACTTCHGTPPESGAHARHDVACASCHQVPVRWDDPGHIVGDAPPAEVVFGGLGALTPNARYEAGGCANVYCHAGATPVWSGTPSGDTCGKCHSLPPPSHVPAGPTAYTCATCHPAAAPHIDGQLQIGTEAGCGGCHSASPASGAHQAHLAASTFRGPVACADCHAVPGAIGDPGHIDSGAPVEVLAALAWDREAETCENGWCHGDAAPRWSQTGEVTCGSCHGLPPTGANHIQDVTLEECTICHTRSVDALGNIVFQGNRSEHIDGNVDFQ